jgi:hypothetical protein
VPVYVGDAASLKRLAPPGSVIYAADFESTIALVAHLKRLARDRDAYESYSAWRTKPASLDKQHRVMALPAWEWPRATRERVHCVNSCGRPRGGCSPRRRQTCASLCRARAPGFACGFNVV